MNPIRSVVIRIYRHSASEFAGVVEDVRSGQSRPFHDVAELLAALLRPVGKRRKPRTPPKT